MDRRISEISDDMAGIDGICDCDENSTMQVSYGYGLFTGGLGAHYGGETAGYGEKDGDIVGDGCAQQEDAKPSTDAEKGYETADGKEPQSVETASARSGIHIAIAVQIGVDIRIRV